MRQVANTCSRARLGLYYSLAGSIVVVQGPDALIVVHEEVVRNVRHFGKVAWSNAVLDSRKQRKTVPRIYRAMITGLADHVEDQIA